MRSATRRALAAVAPTAAKRAHERWTHRRFFERVRPATRAFVDRHGLDVRGGPFAGMHELDDLVDSSPDLVAKLLGTYERELHGAIEALVARRPKLVLDVGAAEGYYAVGLARRLPQARVLAFDVDPGARERCARMARRNGVAERIDIEGECTIARLAELPRDGVALFLDCEGCEHVLLRPDLVPAMAAWPIVVELHEFAHPKLAADLTARFGATHDVEVVDVRPRHPARHPELELLEPRDRSLVLSEFRPEHMRWMILMPVA